MAVELREACSSPFWFITKATAQSHEGKERRGAQGQLGVGASQVRPSPPVQRLWNHEVPRAPCAVHSPSPRWVRGENAQLGLPGDQRHNPPSPRLRP